MVLASTAWAANSSASSTMPGTFSSPTGSSVGSTGDSGSTDTVASGSLSALRPGRTKTKIMTAAAMITTAGMSIRIGNFFFFSWPASSTASGPGPPLPFLTFFSLGGFSFLVFFSLGALGPFAFPIGMETTPLASMLLNQGNGHTVLCFYRILEAPLYAVDLQAHRPVQVLKVDTGILQQIHQVISTPILPGRKD